MNEITLYNCFCRFMVNGVNHEIIEDTVGNRLETFYPLDDLAITFVFNNNSELQNVWVND